MARFKVRREGLFKGGIQVGTNGTGASKMMFGTLEIGVPAITASGGTSASDVSLANAAVGDYIFLLPYAASAGTAGRALTVLAAKVTAATCVSASFASVTGSAVAAHQASMMYFLVG